MFRNILYGIIIGVANIIPGVSGGTMAVMLNVYDKIMYALSLKNVKDNFKFLFQLGAGAALGIFLFSSAVSWVYENYEFFLKYCFIGLIIGSLPTIYNRAKFERAKKKNYIPFGICFVGMCVLPFIQGANDMEAVVEGFPLAGKLIWIAITGFVSVIAMMLPGVSGSFIMLLMGCYTLILQAVAELNVVFLGVFSVGAGCGAVAGIKLIKKMLRNHPQALYFGIIGLMAGSVIPLFPGVPSFSEIAGFLLSFGISYCLGRKG